MSLDEKLEFLDLRLTQLECMLLELKELKRMKLISKQIAKQDAAQKAKVRRINAWQRHHRMYTTGVTCSRCKVQDARYQNYSVQYYYVCGSCFTEAWDPEWEKYFK